MSGTHDCDQAGQGMDVLGANTIFYCRHWAETVAFYRKILRLPVLLEKSWLVIFRLAGGASLSIADAAAATIASAWGKGVTLSLEVADAEAARCALAKKRLSVGDLRTIWGARAFFIFDPEGNRIEFWSPG